ncbi:MAG: polysaccharide deacetylase family protein [Bacteroidales bacterium]|nr:polysaccharide deacetylase family protein [Bacteroidales bacterium]
MKTNNTAKEILLTFDYEMFLGNRSGSVDKCLIDPTDKLLGVLSKHKIKAVFFVDTTYLLKLEEVTIESIQAKNDFDKIINQLRDIADRGHYLFHHLHPHWLDAKYLKDINQWDLSNNKRFTLGSIEESARAKLFEYSHNLLTKIVENTKKTNGYRFGGLFVEPFSSVKKYFEKYKIFNEFSVVPGEKRNGKTLYYDFTNSPKQRSYKFEDSPAIENNHGQFREYPISVIRIYRLRKLFNGIYYRFNKNKENNKIYGDGSSVSAEINYQKQKRNLADYYSMKMPLSVELLNPVLLPYLKKTIQKQNYIHFLSHPKLLTPVSLDCLDLFLSQVNERYNISFPSFTIGE